MALSWKPKKKGDIYCAPACGRGCTLKEHERAQKRGKKLVKRLGPGWELQVWENLGWHYCAVSECGRIKVHPYRRRSDGFHAFLGHGVGGRWTGDGATPKKAVAAVIAEARADVEGLMSLVEGL
jgi:hypothetical protein